MSEYVRHDAADSLGSKQTFLSGAWHQASPRVLNIATYN